ncbi:MAG: PspC domain-containing protein [Chlamydiota bacterium]
MNGDSTRDFYRSTDDCCITGFLGGLGEYFGVNPFIFRLIFLLVGFYSAVLPLLIPYVIASIITKKRPFPIEKKNYVHLYRSRTNRRVGGVIGGIAQIYQMEATPLRILFLIFAIFTIVPFTLTYLFCWALLPIES